MKARLYCPTGDLKGASFHISASATIGRDAGNDIRLQHDQISNRHASIRFDADLDAFLLEDCGSRNGTELDGVPVTGELRLGELHVISFAGCEFVFERLAAEPSADVRETTSIEGEIPTLPLSLGEIAEDAAAPAAHDQTRVERGVVMAPADLVGGASRAAVAEPESPSRSFYLLLAERGRQPRRYVLAEGENPVGRSSRAAVSINAPELSRRHAVLTLEGDRVWIEDRGSRNHTFLAGQRVEARTEVPAGAVLRFANIEARIVEE